MKLIRWRFLCSNISLHHERDTSQPAENTGSIVYKTKAITLSASGVPGGEALGRWGCSAR